MERFEIPGVDRISNAVALQRIGTPGDMDDVTALGGPEVQPRVDD
jgi:hypothetical protein